MHVRVSVRLVASEFRHALTKGMSNSCVSLMLRRENRRGCKGIEAVGGREGTLAYG